MHLTWLEPGAADEPFPPPEMAWQEPNGLIAIGGDLSPRRLINAYQSGIFPWYNEGEPIYWWNPDPRAVLFPETIRITRSLRKSLRNKGYSIRFDTQFEKVIAACAAVREQEGTWISPDMHKAYCQMHQLGRAHSVEVYNPADELVGGLYGIASGGVFSGESMFSVERDVSKMAFVALAWFAQDAGYALIDCQIENSHLTSLGAINIPRKDYLNILRNAPLPTKAEWQFDNDAKTLSDWKPSPPG